MQPTKIRYLASALLAAALAPAAFAAAGRVCPAYPWNVSREVALFAGAPTTVHAGVNSSRPLAIGTDRLYAIRLAPESGVRFALPPGRRRPAPGDEAGILALSVPAAGLYRISIDAPFWIDVVAQGRLLQPTAFHGSRACPGPHKMGVFALPRGTVLLQLSGYGKASVRLTVTRATRVTG